MGRPVSIRNILNRATVKADMVNSGFYDDDQKIDLLNAALPIYYDMLVAAGENYYVAPVYEFNLTTSQQYYTLPEDFYKIISVDYLVSGPGGQAISLKPYQNAERNLPFGNQPSLPTGTIRLTYVPLPGQYTVDDLDETIDGVSGWDELIVTEIAIQMLAREESDIRPLMAYRDRLEARIAAMASNRDQGMTYRQTDVYSMNAGFFGIPEYVSYRLMGDTIGFISMVWAGVTL